MLKWIAFTFGNEGDWQVAASRLRSELQTTGLFDQVLSFNFDEAKSFSKSIAENSAYFKLNSKGFGYWLWKPILMSSLIARFPHHGIAYFDAGCELNVNALSTWRFRRYLRIAEKRGMLVFKLKHFEDVWTKADLIHLISPVEIKFPTNQASASVIFCANENGKKLVADWERIAQMDNYHFLDDTNSILQNSKNFIEHRHDQSILSLLTKSYNLKLKRDETHGPRFLPNLVTPIWAIRNNSGVKKLPKVIGKNEE